MESIKIGKLDLSTGIWLNCLHCNNYFQVKDLKPDPWFGHQGCPFCGAAGYGVDIFRKNPHLGRNQRRGERKRRQGEPGFGESRPPRTD